MRKALALILASVMTLSIASAVFAVDFGIASTGQSSSAANGERSFLHHDKNISPETYIGDVSVFDTELDGMFYGYANNSGQEGSISYELGSDTLTFIDNDFVGKLYASEYIATVGLTYGVYTDDGGSTFTFARFDDFENSIHTDISEAPGHIIAMSMDYTTDTLYGLGSNGILYTIDYTTGSFTQINYISETDAQILIMTIDTDGTMYGITFGGMLYSVDKETAVASLIGDTGYVPNYAQSLVFDHDTQTMYWFYYNGSSGSVLTVDPTTAEVNVVGSADGAELYGIHTISETICDIDPVPVSGVEVTPEATELTVGRTVQLRARVLPNGEYIADKTVTWESSDTSVATVSERGLVTAVGEGTATITATTNDGGFTDSCIVNVLPVDDYYRELSDALNTCAFGEDGYHMYITGEEYAFTVVSVNGRDAVGQSGCSGVDRATSYVENMNPISVIGGSTISFDWMISSEVDYDKAFFYINGVEIASITGEVDWETYTHTFSETGNYTFRWAYTKDGSQSAGQDMMWLDNISFDIVDAQPLEGISLEPETVNVLLGLTTQLTVVYDPPNVANPNVTFESSDESVATVDSNGLVTTVSGGTVTITATAEDGGHTATSVVNVLEPVSIPEMDFTPIEYNSTHEVTLGLNSQYVIFEDNNIRHAVGYSIEMTSGLGALFTIEPGPNPAYDPRITVFNNEFVEVAYCDDYDGSRYPTLEFMPETSGTYYIVITTYHSYIFDSGDIIFNVSEFEFVHVTGITVTPETLHLGRGRYAQLTATLEPADNDFPDIVWSTSDESIVTVEDGRIYGVSDGVATITATSVDGGHSDSATITVGDPIMPEYDGTIYAYRFTDGDETYEKGFISYNPEDPASNIQTVLSASNSYYSGTGVGDLFYGFDAVNMIFYNMITYNIVDAVSFTMQSCTMLYESTTIPIDMTYDYTTETMYGTILDQSSGYHYLGIIDLATGEITEVAPFVFEQTGALLYTLAATNNGELYGCGNDGIYYYIDKHTGMLTEIANMDMTVRYVQTMVYDNYREEMYWFQINRESSSLIVLEAETGEILRTDTLGSGLTEITSAFIYADPATFPETDGPVPVEGITVEPSEITIDVGESDRLKATLIPINASDKKVSWHSNHPDVVAVDEYGNITGIHPGSAYVTATSADGGFTSSAHVTVVTPPESDIPDGMAKITLRVGDVWGDGTGYQMIIDSDANAFENGIIPAEGPLTESGDVPGHIYDEFEIKIPENADGALDTENVVFNDEVSIFIEPGIYDWCITNPTPDETMWIANNGRADNFEFEAGYVYFFEPVFYGSTDVVYFTAEYIGFYVPEEVYTVSFVNYDESLLATYVVYPGEDAIAPEAPIHPDGFEFLGWDTDFTNVQSDLTVKAMFDTTTPPTTEPPTTEPPTTEPPTTEPPTTEPPTTEPPTTEPPAEYDSGDVNMDEVVNTGDAALVLRYAVDLATLTDEQLELADYNVDGKVDTGDAAGILRFAVGLRC